MSAHIARVVRGLCAIGIDTELVERAAVAGEVAETVAQVADEVHADVVVVGAASETDAGAFLDACRCPVLVVPAAVPAERVQQRTLVST